MRITCLFLLLLIVGLQSCNPEMGNCDINLKDIYLEDFERSGNKGRIRVVYVDKVDSTKEYYACLSKYSHQLILHNHTATDHEIIFTDTQELPQKFHFPSSFQLSNEMKHSVIAIYTKTNGKESFIHFTDKKHTFFKNYKHS